MQDTPMCSETADPDYQAGFSRIVWFVQQAKLHGLRLSDRQIVHEIMQRERAAQIREQSSLPIVGPGVRSVAWNRGQADALRELLHAQREQYGKGL
ncbi:MAG: hypothetical protein E6J34_22265 [Chloroflexi bacterium]|nr:MAG: hypothetical protein E6J34_22265 [Chloroflexota bacterium]